MTRSQLKHFVLPRCISFALGLSLLTELSAAQLCQIEQVQRIDSTTVPINKGYATALAISGNTVIVGDKEDDLAGANAGAAYIYSFDATQWNLTQTLRPDDLVADDQFGTSVAIDGTRVVIGAPRAGGGIVRHGAAYV